MGMRETARWQQGTALAALGLSIALLAWVSGGPLVVLRFGLFLGAFLLPALAVVSAFIGRALGPRTLSVFLAFHTLVMLLVPLFLLRKAIAPWGWGLDALLVLVACGAAARKEVRDFVRRWDAEAEVARDAPFVVLGVCSIFALLWLGFEDVEGDRLWYAGQFGIDYGNLSNVVTLLRISPDVPFDEVPGEGALNYHWLFFTLPAYFCEFAGWDVPSTDGLVLWNVFVACFLYLWLLEAAALLVPQGGSRRVRHATAAVVVFASHINYATDTISGLLPFDVLAALVRNTLILSPLHSMANFGNNTLAVGSVLALPPLLAAWNQRQRPLVLLLGVGVWLSLIGLSVTLFFSVSLALGVWGLAGRIHALWKVLLATSVLGLLGAAVYVALEVVGATSGSLSSEFDGGSFLLRTLMTHTPLLVLAVIGAFRSRSLDFYPVIWLCALIVPSWLFVRSADFSMKNGTLMAVILTPLVGRAIHWFVEEGGGQLLLRGLAAGLCALGLLNSSAYLGQFAYYTLTGSAFRGNLGFSIPTDYWRVLECLRGTAQRDVVVWDLVGTRKWTVGTTLLIGERRSHFPQRSSGLPTEPDLLRQRLAVWDAFQRGETSAQELLETSDWELAIFAASNDWEPRHARLVCRFGDHRLYAREAANANPPPSGSGGG